jgi:imidazolonepropionase-like amidohydrolase
MTPITRRLLLCTAAATVAFDASAQGKPNAAKKREDKPPEKSFALVGGAIWRHDGDPIEDGVIVITGDRVDYVGDDKAKADGLETIAAAGQVVTAGLTDLLTDVGVKEVDLEETTLDMAERGGDHIRAAFRTADGYNPASPVVAISRKGGLTSVGVVPTEGLVSGQSAWADLAGRTAAAALARPSLALHVHLSDPWYGGFEGGRGTAILRLRELLEDARAYRASKQAYERRQLRELTASRLDLEAVLGALDGTLPTVIHADRASDILVALEIAAENKLRLVLASAAEGWAVAEEIAKAKVPAIVYGLDDGPRSFAALGAREDNAALLAAAGVTIALSSGETHNARKLRQVAGNAVRAGLPPRIALDAVTDAPARIMGMAATRGALVAGRGANLVVWSGDPLELSTRVLKVFIRGKAQSLRTRQTALLERYR